MITIRVDLNWSDWWSSLTEREESLTAIFNHKPIGYIRSMPLFFSFSGFKLSKISRKFKQSVSIRATARRKKKRRRHGGVLKFSYDTLHFWMHLKATRVAVSSTRQHYSHDSSSTHGGARSPTWPVIEPTCQGICHLLQPGVHRSVLLIKTLAYKWRWRCYLVAQQRFYILIFYSSITIKQGYSYYFNFARLLLSRVKH